MKVSVFFSTISALFSEFGTLNIIMFIIISLIPCIKPLLFAV